MGKIDPAAIIFLTEFQKTSPTIDEVTQEIAKNHITDLTPTQGHFTPDTQDLLSAEAGRRWAQKRPAIATHEELRKSWRDLARDFHIRHWDFSTVTKKVKRPKKTNIAAKMIITTFTSFVGTKCLVLYFGSAELNDPSTTNQICLIAAVLLSFVTLFYFAFKNGKAMQEEDRQD